MIYAELELYRGVRNFLFRSAIHHCKINNVNQATIATLIHKSTMRWLNPFIFEQLLITARH